ncbi:MAG: hypothetical protein PV358_11455, partial [Acidimicrobiales bacterium]|nr:hypothetical protein [Acidimicrobiales bacterium]
RDDVPAGIAGLKLYGNLRTGEPEAAAASAADALARLSARWSAIGRLHDLLADLRFLEPHFTTVEVDAAGRIGHKLYLRTRGGNAAGLAVAARRAGAALAPVADALREAGVADDVWRRRLFVCAASRPVGGAEDRAGVSDGGAARDACGGREGGVAHGRPDARSRAGGSGDRDGDRAGAGECELSVHLPAKALRLDRAGMARLARLLVERHGDTAGLGAMEEAVARTGGGDRWTTTVVGLGLTPEGGVGKVNVYMCRDGELGV